LIWTECQSKSTQVKSWLESVKLKTSQKIKLCRP